MGVNRRHVRGLIILGCGLLWGPASVAAQSVDVGDPNEDYVRLLQISGEAPASSFSVRPLIFREGEGRATVGPSGPHPWATSLRIRETANTSALRVDAFDASARVMVNTGYPSVTNDGVVWQGKGVNTAVDFGSTLRWRGVRLTVKPTLTWSQNADFELAPVTVAGQPEYAYPWRRIDLPQRFGPDSFWRLDPGQSELRVSGRGVTAGVGTRNLWWGPGIRSAIILSNNAGGFPHAFLGTRGPRSIGIGTLEANWIWGRIAQSDWFDPTVENDDRFVTGIVLAYSPSFLSGLSVGLTRMYYGAVPPEGFSLSDYFLVFQRPTKSSQTTPENPSGDDDKDQLVSLFGRWVLPESGFEVYVEWARNDHSASVYDFLLEPEHSQAYTVGLQKALELSRGNRLALRGELTHLQREPTYQLRASPVYYAHHIVTQGYTHRGQVLGAGVGPGGNQQHFSADLYTHRGRVGLLFQRRVADNDAYYEWAAATDGRFDQHDVSFDLGANAMVFVGDFEVGGGLIYTRQLNRYFFGPKVNNVNLSLSARWRPAG